MKAGQYSLFWNRAGERKYFRASGFALPKERAAQVFQSHLLAPYFSPNWPSNIRTSLRRCEGKPVVGWPEEIQSFFNKGDTK